MSSSRFTAPSLAEMNELLSAFEFEGELSSNEVGAVYYARQKSMDRHVAVKLFSRDKGRDERFLISLKRASNQMTGLKHPNLIGFFDSGLIDGMPYVVLEFVPGKSLHRSTHGRTIEFDQSLAIIKEVCEGIAYAHTNQVVHGNLSPLNILLNQQATPKIGNFALGRAVHTLPGVEVATHFSAPEVLAGEVHTAASDVYSLGAIFYELITATPYRAGGPRASHLEAAPKAVDAVIAKATAIDPKERHAGAMEFFNALRKAALDEPEPSPAAQPAAAMDSPASPGMAPPASPGMVPPASPGESPTPMRSKAMEMAMSTSGTGILVKAVIILVLLIAIQQVWSLRKEEKAKRELAANGGAPAGDKGVTSFEMTKLQREARQREQVAQQQPEAVDFPDDPETPAQSLERLRSALAAGNYSELPIGTLSQGGSHYFLVEEAMTWEGAAAYAEQLGGTIALPADDMGWAKKEPFAGRSLWLGAARSGATAFTLLNAKAWQPKTEIAGAERFVCLDESGGLTTAAAATSLPHVIQWSTGIKPLGLEARLAACAASIKSGQAVYPPGTIANGERHYLPVSNSVTWEQASQAAQSAGGNLLALSDDGEAAGLGELAAQLPSGSSFWLGGRLEGERWQWVTAEPWRAVEWTSVSNAAADDAAMILRGGAGLDATAKSAAADGYIIEWSKDAETNKSDPSVAGPALTTPSEMTEVARQLVVKAIADKEAAHTKNTDKLAWDLRSHVRGLKKSDQDLLAPEVEKLTACVQNNRLLKETIEASGAQLSPFMVKLCDFIIRKQGEIDEQHVKSLQAIHASYLKKLGEIRDQAKTRGQVKAQLAAEELINDSQNHDAWIARMSVAPQQ